MSELTWLITGSSRGFGRALATSALAAGDRVVATARNRAQVADLAEQYPDRAIAVPMDVTDQAAVQAAFESGLERFGGLDVVVNNAGYANVAPVETGPEDDFRQQFDTNFWGVYNVSRAAIPVLRKLGGGTIIQFSSIGGRVGGSAGIGSYQAAKFAVDGLTRVLAAETAPMGIRYLVIEPGGFATDWAGSSMQVLDIPAEYEQTVGTMARYRSGATAAGDPQRAGEILVRMVRRRDLPTHLILGAGAVQMAQNYSRGQLSEADTWARVSQSADFDQEYPADFPADSKTAPAS
jgi:NAD(P)-dependent dehydrogenase (short-subunit alcohol dehydrogenase family)